MFKTVRVNGAGEIERFSFLNENDEVVNVYPSKCNMPGCETLTYAGFCSECKKVLRQ